MKRYVLLLVVSLVSLPAWSGTKPAIPSPQPNLVTPEAPDARRAQAIVTLKQWISEDKATIAKPGSGKARELKERVRLARENLKMNEAALADLEAGKDMTVYCACPER